MDADPNTTATSPEPRRVKAIDLALHRILPERYHELIGSLDSKNINRILTAVEQQEPDNYASIMERIANLGRQASYVQGETLRLEDLRPPFDRRPLFDAMDAELAEIDSDLDPTEAQKQRQQIYGRYATMFRERTLESAADQDNNLIYGVLSGARGKPDQLVSMITTPSLYTDYRGEVVPLFVRHSYAEGLRPGEYLASTFGARSSVIDMKGATAEGGDIGKQLGNIGTRIVVREDDCGTTNGIDFAPDEESLRGRVLARPVAGMDAGTILDRDALGGLQRARADRVLVRSPLTCQTPNGICSKCSGTRADGKLPAIGDSVGVTSAQSVSEPVTQNALSSKHSSGVFEGDAAEFSGLDILTQILQSPKMFPHKAQVAELDGAISRIEEAPQGGHNVYVDEQRHYVPPQYPLQVAEGDRVEAGDQISGGLVDVKDILALRGLGEGRRFYANQLKQILDASGVETNLRDTEMLARAAIDHVRITDNEGFGSYLPDDVVSYNALQSGWEPAEDAHMERLDDLTGGEYLQAPALHYTVGDRLTPSKIGRLRDAGWSEVPVSRSPTAFTPEMSRLRVAASENYPDWMARLSGSYLQRYLSDSAVRGHDSAYRDSDHFAGPLAYGVDFGKNVRTEGKF